MRALVGVRSLWISEVIKGRLTRKLAKEVETSEDGGADRHIEEIAGLVLVDRLID